MATKKEMYRIDTLDEYDAFVKGRLDVLERSVSNCFGTGLFCTGEMDSDEYCHGEDPDRILNALRRAKSPSKGMLVSWYAAETVDSPHHLHLAIIMQKDPVLITHRIGYRGPIVREQAIKEIETPSYGKRTYLVPKLLENILESK
jgi:hypothetical protein